MKQIFPSEMYVDGTRVQLSNSYLLDINKDHDIKILLEGNLVNASYMFETCTDMSIEFSKNFNDTKRRIFDKSKLKYTKKMFSQTNNLAIDISFFNTKNFEDMSYMLYNSQSLHLYNSHTLDTSSVTNMERMFGSCYKKEINLINFNTKNVTKKVCLMDAII